MLSILIFSVIAFIMCMTLVLVANKKQSLVWCLLVLSVVVATLIAFDSVTGVLSSRVSISYLYIISVIILVVLFFVIAYVMKENDKTFGAFLALMCAVGVIATFIIGSGNFNFGPREEEVVVEEEHYASELEEYASHLSEEQLTQMFGRARRFKDTSLNTHRSARVKKTKLKDALTYNWGDKENEMIEEALANPIYLQSLNYILQDARIVGLSNWAKSFTQNDYTNYVGRDGWVTDEYHLIACRYLAIFKQAQFVEKSKGWTAKIHYGLDSVYEGVNRTQSQSKVASNWQIYKFANRPFTYDDGSTVGDTFIAFSCNDGRFAIMKKGQKTASKKNTGGSKANVDASNAKANVGASAPTVPVVPDFDWNAWWNQMMPPAVPYTPEPYVPVDPTPYAPGEQGLEVNRIPDYYGNAPVGGFGSGVDNMTAGTLQPSEPAHVYSTPSKHDDTRITYDNGGGSYSSYSTKGVDRTDSNKPSSAPVQSNNTTTYSTAGTTTSSSNTGNTAIDDVNDGVVDGF